MGIRMDLLVTEEIVDFSVLRASPFEFERAKRVEVALSILEGKWKIVILNRLFARPVWRFSESEHAVPGISHRMLSQQLRTLEKRDLVKRTVHPRFPPKVEYELTKFGRTLCPAMMTLVDWAMKFPRIREMFDEESTKALTALLVAVREGAILAGPQGPLWHWLLERKHHQAGRLARQRLDLRELPLQGKVQKRIVRAATRGLPKWPHFSLPPTQAL